MAPRFLTFLVAFVAGPLLAAPALAGEVDLFAPSSADRVVATASLPSVRTVTIPPAAAAALADGAADVVRIEIAPGIIVKANRQNAETTDGLSVWAGDPADDDLGAVDLVVRGGNVTGQVTYGKRTWRIDPVSGGVHRVTRVIENRPVKDIVKVPPASKMSAPADEDAIGVQKASTTTIRVLVGYTPAAAKAVSDIKAQAALAVSLANSAYNRSGTLIKLQLAGTKKYSYNEATGDWDDLFNGFTAATGGFKSVPADRNAAKADLVSVLTAFNAYCGMAWLGPSKTLAFSQVSVDCITYHSFAHEIGHNLGLQHDRYVEPKSPASQYNFGFVNKAARVRDIMSYGNACSDVQIYCTRVPIFSTPNKTWKGAKIGIAPGKKGAAFAAKSLNETRKTVAGFR